MQNILRRAGWMLLAVFLCFDMIQARAIAQAPDSIVNDSNGQSYRLVQASHFEMGAENTEAFRKDHVNREMGDAYPRHAVILSRPFYIATTEVTVAQFRKFVKSTDHVTTAEESKTGIVGWKPTDNERGDPEIAFAAEPSFTWRSPGFDQDDNHPVTGVSYHDAKAYCMWLSKEEGETYRLPTEAEWECACRAGTQTHFSFGDEYQDQVHEHANVADVSLEKTAPRRGRLQWLFDTESGPEDGFAFTAPVGSYQANPWGLHDMHGNVWEWCEDHYLDTFYQEFKKAGHGEVRKRAIDPVCTERWNQHGQWRVIRGGSWFVAPLQSRSGGRGVFNASDAACYVGFRVVREVSAKVAEQATAEHEKSEAALTALKTIARETREYDDQHIRFDIVCEALSDEVFQHLNDLQYEVDITIRPPGHINSKTINKFATSKHLVGFGLATTCTDVDKNTFAMLAKHPQLERLQVTGTGNLADDQLFPHLRSATKLTSIGLQGDGLTDAGLAQLPELKELRDLHVSSTKINGESFGRFAGSPLIEIGIQHLTDAGAAELAEFPTLSRLSLPNCPITRRGLESIVSLPNLTSLNLNGCQNLSDDDIALVGKLKRLHRLQLIDTSAGDVTLSALADSLLMRQLFLGSENLTDRGMNELCNIIPLQELQLTKNATNITDDSFRDFWRLQNLRVLSVYAPDITGLHFDTLTELPKLRSVAFSSSGISENACRHLSNIEPLEELTVGSWDDGGMPELNDEMLLQLAEAPKLKKLTVIRNGTAITDEGVERLEERLTNVKLVFR